MDLCVIAPLHHLDLTKLGDMHFIIANWALEYPEYADFYRREKLFKIMDNGAFEEGKPLDDEKILEAAKIVKADEVVVPDQPDDPEYSLELTKDFFTVLSKDEIKQYRWQVVPHGKTISEYILNLTTLAMRCEFTDTIGLSILDLYKWNYRLRPLLMDTILQLVPASIQLHLLGLDEFIEVWSYSLQTKKRLRSVDTSLPITLASRLQSLSEHPEKHDFKRVSFLPKLNCAQQYQARVNIRHLKRHCR